MSVTPKSTNRVIASESFSTSAAEAALASETRAFGNAYAKLQLQQATTAFELAKQKLTSPTTAPATDQKTT